MTNVKTGVYDSAAVSEIKKVSFTNHGRGAGIGAGVGAGIGTAFAILVLMSAVEADKEPPGEGQTISATGVALIFAAPTLILGGTGTGALIGLIKGYETNYKFE